MDKQLGLQLKTEATKRNKESLNQVDIRLLSAGSLNQSQKNNSSGNLPTHNVRLERSPESVKHLGDYLPSSPSVKKPPKPKNSTIVTSKDLEMEKTKRRNQ